MIHPNECFVLKSDRNSVLARYNPFTHSIIRVMKGKNYGIEPRNAEQSFAFEILNDPNIKLVALTGKAGTGKTLLALAAALGKLTDYKQILLAISVRTSAAEEPTVIRPVSGRLTYRSKGSRSDAT